MTKIRLKTMSKQEIKKVERKIARNNKKKRFEFVAGLARCIRRVS